MTTCEFWAGDNRMSALFGSSKNYYFLPGTLGGGSALGGPWTLSTLPTRLLRHCHCDDLVVQAEQSVRPRGEPGADSNERTLRDTLIFRRTRYMLWLQTTSSPVHTIASTGCVRKSACLVDFFCASSAGDRGITAEDGKVTA